ncbi:MAG: tRNA lysidine(34) synthetase TilS [Clostridia bacterium]|nr:tRNA lysidine(34) synthetase TilS [Clostridia bacterium]
MIKLEWKGPEEKPLVLAAVSGGADSVALLSLLCELAGRGAIRLAAAHFEHGIRGGASRADAAFVRVLCEDWGVPLIEGRADVPALAKARGAGLEQTARDARYAFLRRAKADTGADVIALAHHLDDQAETVLMHLARGAGLRGACGMREREGDLWRPLLGLRKAELTAYLLDNAVAWREDETNALADNPRNIIRLSVMPALETAYPGAARALGRFAALARDEDAYMEAQASAFLAANAEFLPFGSRVRCLDGVPAAILRRAIHRLTGLDAAACLASEELFRAGKGAAALPGGVRAERTGEYLYFISRAVAPVEAPLPMEGRAALPGVGEIVAAPAEAAPRSDPFCQVLDGDSLSGAVVRTRRPGDFIRPLGMRGTQKLSDYFINHRVDRPLRDAALLVARGSEILWAAGVGISEEAKLRPGSKGVRLEAREYRKSWEENS